MSRGLAIVYDRASSKQQEGNFTRQDVRRIGFEMAKRYGYDTESEPRVEIKSGEELKNRPVMMGILEFIENGKLVEGKPIRAIVVPNFTRLSRDEDVIDGMVIRKSCRDHGVVVIDFTGKIYDFEKENDQDTALIEFWFAARDKRQIVTTLTRGMKEKARQGGQMGGMAPLGYTLVPTAETNRRGKTLHKRVIDEEEANLVRRIFKLYRETSAYGTIKTLNREGVQLPVKNKKLAEQKNGGTSKACRAFQPADVIRIVTNPIYAGWVAWNTGRAKYRAKSRYLRDLEPQMHFDPSLQIISQEEFDHVQWLIKERGKIPPRSVNSVHPFALILKCRFCGGPMNGSASTAKRRTTGKVYNSIYRCYIHWHNPNGCQRGQSIRTTIVAKAIIPLAAQLLDRDSNLIQSLRSAAKEYSGTGTVKQIEAQTRAELETTKQSIQRLINSISHGVVTEDEANPTLTELRDKRDRLTGALGDYEEKNSIRKELLDALQTVQNAVQGEVEPFLWQMYQKKPSVLTRLMRLMFQPRSVIVESQMEGWNKYSGKIVDYKLREEFKECIVSTSSVLRS